MQSAIKNKGAYYVERRLESEALEKHQYIVRQNSTSDWSILSCLMNIYENVTTIQYFPALLYEPRENTIIQCAPHFFMLFLHRQKKTLQLFLII